MSKQWIEKNGVKRPVYDNPGDFPATCMMDYQSPEERIVWGTSTCIALPIPAVKYNSTFSVWMTKEDVEKATGGVGIPTRLSDSLRRTRQFGREALLLLDSDCNILEEWPIA